MNQIYLFLRHERLVGSRYHWICAGMSSMSRIELSLVCLEVPLTQNRTL